MPDDRLERELSKYLDGGKYEEIIRQAFESQSRRLTDQQKNVTSLVDLEEGDLLLDIGCGSGKYSAIFSHRATVVAIDFSIAAIEVSRETVEKYGVPRNVLLCQSFCQILPFKDSTFDKVLCIDLVEHLYPDDFQSMIDEIRRVLKDGGRLYIYTPNRIHVSELVKKLLRRQEPGHIGLKTSGSIARSLSRSGYHTETVDHKPSHFAIYRQVEQRLMGIPLLGRLFRKRICIVASK
jgi:cyclopropane fatty-acyl-phospholipid synthase-like methyltransferase